MGVLPRVKYYLVHIETGQRYPVGESEVVIGRNSGDLLFPEDAKLSSQHCRIFFTSSGHLGIQDLSSVNGTIVDGKTLSRDKSYSFKPGNELSVGLQVFRLQEAGYAKSKTGRRRRKRKRKGGSSDWVSQALVFAFGLAALAGGSHLLHMRQKAVPEALPPVESPYEMVDREVRAVFDNYKKFGKDQETAHLGDKQLAWNIRHMLLPDLSKVQTKLGVVRPQTEFERRKLELNRKMVNAMIGQVTAMAEFAETKSKKASENLKLYSDQLQTLNQQAQALKRSPAQDQDFR
jgi:pSer/pThr/pTyr-binding forkhead associated (FHA) protein